MSKSNRKAKEELIRLYGPECFIEKLQLRKGDKPRKYKGKGQYHRMKQLTYHHILEKSKGGQATVENGALLNQENHNWFHQQPKEKQKEMNEAFQDYKRGFRLNIARVTTEEVTPIETIKLPEIEEDCIEIPLEPMTPEKLEAYKEYKRKRNERVFNRFGVETSEQKWKREQRKIIEDNLMEMRY